MTKPSLQRILVPVDYLPAAKSAAKTAALLAKNFNAELFVLHSYGLPVVGLAEGIVIADDIRQVQEKKLDDFISALQAEYDSVKINRILEFGTAVEWISKVTEDKTIDLIVMGTRGDTDAASFLFGSVTSHAINHVKCPVLIIPKGYHLHTINELIFASDFHPTNNSAEYMAPVLALIREYEPFVHLVNFSSSAVSGIHNREIEEQKLVEILKETKHTFHYLEANNVEEALYEFTEKYHGDLIVAVTRHYRVWERIFHRSLTKKLALHSEVPLLILHEDGVTDQMEGIKRQSVNW